MELCERVPLHLQWSNGRSTPRIGSAPTDGGKGSMWLWPLLWVPPSESRCASPVARGRRMF